MSLTPPELLTIPDPNADDWPEEDLNEYADEFEDWPECPDCGGTVTVWTETYHGTFGRCRDCGQDFVSLVE